MSNSTKINNVPPYAILRHESDDKPDLDDDDIKVLQTPRVLNMRKVPEDNTKPKLRTASAVNMPKAFSLMNKFKHAVTDQGQLGACCAFAVSSAYEFLDPNFYGSQLFLYFITRDREGTIESDAGCILSNAIDLTVKTGIAHAKTWPYDIAKFSERPPAAAFVDASKHQTLVQVPVSNDLISIKSALYAGFPIVICIGIYPSFQNIDSYKTGDISMPSQGERCVGGHCVLLTGWDDDKQRLEGRNSWSDKWGNKGNFTLPYGYINENDSWQPYQIRKVEMSDQINNEPQPVQPINHWKQTEYFEYASIFVNNTVTVSFKPKIPCASVTLTFNEEKQPPRNVPMTYRDLVWTFLIGNVQKEKVATINYKFTYIPQTTKASESFVGTT